MATKLFAMEDIEEGMDVEMEASPEVAEVADAQMDAAPEEAEVADLTEGVDQGTEAADEMEEVQELVEASAEEGEGLDPIAAEAIGLAIKAICSKIGANPSSVYSMYAGENFSSPSTRKANTKLAAEGIGSFIADMWKRIKAALKKLWDKAKKLWDKHLSTLGRTKKALEAMKKKVSSSTGTFKGPSFLDKAPSSLKSAFPLVTDITKSTFTTYKGYQDAARTELNNLRTNIAQANALITKSTPNAEGHVTISMNETKYNFGSETQPLTGGGYAVYKFKAEDKKVEFESETNTVESSTDEVTLKLSGKDDVKQVLESAETIIKEAINAKKGFDADEKQFNSTMSSLDAKATKKEENMTEESFRIQARAAYKINSKIPTLSRYIVATEIQFAYAALKYASVCLSHYTAKK